MAVSSKIWTTQLVDEYNRKYSLGIDMETNTSPYFEGKYGWRNGGINFKTTEEEREEILKCKMDVLYFANKYAYAMTDDGIAKINLRPYQKEVLKAFQDNRFCIYLSSRQVGKTIMSAIFITWYLCFHFDRNVLVVANKMDTTSEIVSKIKAVMHNLPFFLKPGVTSLGVTGLSLDNGCRIYSSATTPSAGIGFTNHLVYADEFAYVHNNISEKFYKSIFPTLSSSKISRMILTSTPNGKNLFYRIYKGALEKKNNFVSLRTDWWEVPGRDEQWKKQEIANLGGSEELFNQEYGNSFDSSTRILANANVLRFLEKIKKEYVWQNIEELETEYYRNDKLLWHPKYFHSLTDDDKFVVTVDMGSGVGIDNTVINIFKVCTFSPTRIYNYNNISKSENDFITFLQVGRFKDNFSDNSDVAYLLADLVMDYLLPENTLVVIEMNHRGNELKKDMEHYRSDIFDYDIFFKGMEKNTKKGKIKTAGVWISKDKVNECKNLLKDWINKRIIPTDVDTILEVGAFGLNDKGSSYEGLGMHDDLVITQLHLTKLYNTVQFNELIESIISKYDNYDLRLIEEKINN